MKALTTALLLVILQCSHALSPTDCDASKPLSEKVLDLINKGRRSGYAFQLLRVSDAHLDSVGTATIYYLVLDVIESDCWVLSTKAQDDCLPARWPSEIVIGQCKVIATRYSNESQDLRVNGYNCTTSSVSSALGNTKDSPVLLDFFEDSELYRKQAQKALDKYKRENGDFASFRVERAERVIRARGGERTNYYVEFSVRNCSTQHFPRYPPVFGFCRAVLSYSIEAFDLETPEYTDINCEVFNTEDHKNMSDIKPHWSHEHPLCDKHLCKFSRFRDYHNTQKTYELGCPPPPEGKDNSDTPSLQEGALPQLPPSHPPPSTRGPPHNHSCSEHSCHGHHPHGQHPHGHHPHGHHPHGHHPHGQHPHEHHPHGHHLHRHHPHGHHPHGHHPHGDHPHGHHPHSHHPHGHNFLDYGPCDPPSNSQELKGQYHRGYGPPHGHSRKRGPGKGLFSFHQQQIGYVYRLPPLNTGEVLTLPEANFPSFSLPNCNRPLQPEIQPFPQTPSKSCPGKFESKFPQTSKFFGYMPPK
ncbi:histidine-rich glycoprotein [Arvicanthis niloticus]|uniref:histidine-rich glycoprotein n=1 Tax=Arvicanthis niloticus TaxID=61156 RepID=UPI0014861C5B|nr:histidine-rich glycoprotein [Arvicanthis niloticus]